MKILRLKLENFRQHLDTEVHFQDGMTAIIGANGAGKSTLLEAMTYALYGEQRKTKDTIRSYWAEPKAKFRVTLTFEFDGRKFAVERTGSDATLHDVTEGATLRATGLREVKSSCEKLIGLNYEQFTNSFCAEQKELAFLNFKNNAVRQDEVARMLGYERLRQAANLGKERSRGFRIKADTLQDGLASVESLNARKVEAERRLLAERRCLESATKKGLEIERSLPASFEAYQSAERFRILSHEIDKLRLSADHLKTNIKRAELGLAEEAKKAEEHKALLSTEQEFRKLETRVKEFEEKRETDRKREALTESVARIGVELNAIEQQIASMNLPDLVGLGSVLRGAQVVAEGAQRSLRVAGDDWNEARRTAESEFGKLASLAEQARKIAERASEMAAKGICPECGQPTSGDYKEIVAKKHQEAKRFGVEAEAAGKKVEMLRDPPKSVTDAEAVARTALEGWERARAAHSLASEAHAQADLLLKQKEPKSKQLAEDVERLAKTPTSYDRAQHDGASKRLEELRPGRERFLRLAGAEEELAKAETLLAVAKADFETARLRCRENEAEREKLPLRDKVQADLASEHYRALMQEKAVVDSELLGIAQRLEYATNEVARAAADIEQHGKKTDEMNAAKHQQALHDVTARELGSLREALNKTVRPELEARASENLNLLTNGRYPTLQLTDNFEPILVEDDIQKPVISGGEEDVVALALRLALSELIQERQGRPMSLLILDEVFGSLDADRRQSVLERLASIKGRFRQIFVISHIEEINQVADHCLFLHRDSESHSTKVYDAPPMHGDLLLTGADAVI